jgi:uncharacterized membrane protein
MGNRQFSESRKPRPPLGIFKTTILGALLVVVPVGIVGFALWQIYALAKGMLGPVFAQLPFDDSTLRVLVIVAAILVLVLVCWVTGALVRTRWGRKLREWVECMLFERIPGYRMVRSLVHQYLGQADERKFQPVMVDLYGTGTKMIGLEIEKLGDGTVAVFFPSVPAVTLGQVQIVPQERVTDIPASLQATVEVLTMFGEGASALIERPPGERKDS